MKRKLRRITLISAIFLLALTVTLELRFRMNAPDVYSSGNNGMWLRHPWVGESHSAQNYDDLTKMLDEMKITDAFFHAGPFNGDGSIPESRYSHASNLIYNIKKVKPGIRLYAWLGQVEAKGGGLLNISSKNVRDTILKTAEHFLNLGFDGIHLNIEPVYSNDQSFLDLLHAMHEITMRHGKKLSLSTYKPERIPGSELMIRRFSRNPGYWQKDYFLKVAKEVDQIVVMTYDSGCLLPFVYGDSISWTTKWCVENSIKDLLIGIPTYDEYKGGHFPYVENVDNALLGLKQGISTLDESDRKKAGASIYAEWTTSESEKETYKSRWIGKR